MSGLDKHLLLPPLWARGWRFIYHAFSLWDCLDVCLSYAFRATFWDILQTAWAERKDVTGVWFLPLHTHGERFIRADIRIAVAWFPTVGQRRRPYLPALLPPTTTLPHTTPPHSPTPALSRTTTTYTRTCATALHAHCTGTTPTPPCLPPNASTSLPPGAGDGHFCFFRLAT